jgi:hypothetical protein
MDVAGPAPKQEWIDAYQAAKSANLIPAIPQTVLQPYASIGLSSTTC